jgi:hypothetical protein
MEPQMCLLTTGGLGIGFAVAKTITAFAIGIFGGLAARAVIKAGGFASPLKAKISGCGGCKPKMADEKLIWAFWQEQVRQTEFNSSFLSTLFFLGKCGAGLHAGKPDGYVFAG